MNEFTENDIMFDVFSHVGEKRHSRIKGYYVCLCGNQYIFFRPYKKRTCLCGREMPLISKIDEFEEAIKESLM